MSFLVDSDDVDYPSVRKSSWSIKKSKLHGLREPTETSPLLRPDSPITGEILDVPLQSSHARSPRFIVTWVILVVMMVLVGDQLAEVPQMRIFESIYCYQYWEKVDHTKLLVGRAGVGPGAVGGVDEKWCKIPQIQGKVAELKGYQTLFDGIPSE